MSMRYTKKLTFLVFVATVTILFVPNGAVASLDAEASTSDGINDTNSADNFKGKSGKNKDGKGKRDKDDDSTLKPENPTVYSSSSQNPKGEPGNIVDTGLPDGTEVARARVTNMTLDGKVKSKSTEIIVEGQPDTWTAVDESRLGDEVGSEVGIAACPSGRKRVDVAYVGRGLTGVYYRFYTAKVWSYSGCRVYNISTWGYAKDLRFNVSYQGVIYRPQGYYDGGYAHYSMRQGHMSIWFGYQVNHYPWGKIWTRASGSWDYRVGIG